MKAKGTLRKMKTEVPGTGKPVAYKLPIGEELPDVNAWIGKKLSLKYTGEIFCISCGKKTKKSFNQGFCYPCFINGPESEECVMRPELCRAHEGQARDMEFAKSHCLIPQFVYLSLTSDLKVGVTRNTQIPTRWIDQGALQAIKLAKTPNRYTAGLVEVALKKHMKDKTDWRKMLKNVYPEDLDLKAAKADAITKLPEDLAKFVVKDNKITKLVFPVEAYPEKIKSVGFDKLPLIEGTLHGIKGQYLLLDDNRVLNIRKHAGYMVELKV